MNSAPVREDPRGRNLDGHLHVSLWSGWPAGERVSDMAQGTVKWFDTKKGFGFITQDSGGPDVFVDYTELEGAGFRSLAQGQRVVFEIRHTKTGPEAKDVRVVPN
ncbi:cold shock CspA family protein [Nocardia sp. GAS34]